MTFDFPCTRLLLCTGLAVALLSGCTTRFSPNQTCGDGVLGAQEVCDGSALAGQTCQSQGYHAGTLACAGDCATFDTSGCGGRCGDGAIDPEEVCDSSNLAEQTCQSQGYYGGTLACAGDCTAFDTSGCGGRCGDGAIDPEEVCDGSNLAEQTCEARGYYGGVLACADDCQTYDTGGCDGRCGDGVLNGPEVCDGAAVGGRLCSDFGYWGGLLDCRNDCGEILLDACWSGPHVVINEASLAVPDWAELKNVSEREVDLSGWQIRWTAIQTDGHFSQGTLTLPAGAALAAGARLVVVDQNGGDGSPPTLEAPDLVQAHVNIAWGVGGGSAMLLNPHGAPVDFARWGTSTEAPAGTSWSDGAGTLPSPGDNTMSALSLSRIPDGVDTDSADDFCVTDETQAAPNAGACRTPATPGTLLLSEILPDTDDVEILNPGQAAVDLDGWWILGDPNTLLNGRILPAFTLGPGQHVAVMDDAPNPDAPYADLAGLHIGDLYLRSSRGRVALLDPTTRGVDFIGWGWLANGITAVPPDQWSGGLAPSPATGLSLSRSGSTDTDTAADWCEQTPSMGQPNDTCP